MSGGGGQQQSAEKDGTPRLTHIRERLLAFRPDPSSAPTNRAVEDMQWLVRTVDDLRSRLACAVEATYWDRPYEERIAAIRGLGDLTADGMTPACEPDAHGYDCRCDLTTPPEQDPA